MKTLLIVFVLSTLGTSFKYLVYSPQFGNSHVNFLGRLADILVEEGHDVVVLSPVLDHTIGTTGTRKARVIEVPQVEEGKLFSKYMTEGVASRTWTHTNFLELFEIDMDVFVGGWKAQCNATLRNPGLMEKLKTEKFDAAFSESVDYCFAGLFHLLGIEKFAITESMAISDGHFYYTQVPSNPAYVPGMIYGDAGDQMTFLERTQNLLFTAMCSLSKPNYISNWQPVFEGYSPDFPNLMDLINRNSLVFINSEPLIDFPAPSAARMIDIGGISISNHFSPLNKTWSDILDLRPHTVLISFGTFVKSFLMPDAYKQTIRETARRFPNVTFIWKYEKPEDGMSEGIANLIETTWMPQKDLINDPRLSLFVTHGGQGSFMESSYAGVPLITIPVEFDQLRNGASVKKHKQGIVLTKEDLATVEPLESAIREILENSQYRQQAKKIQQTLNERPFAMRDIFVKNMEFLAKHGPLRQLDHYGRHLNYFQYYLVDVIAFIGFVVISVLVVLVLALKFCICCVVRKCSSKVKAE